MKLNYAFELMEMDDEVVAVPVGDNAGKLHGIVKLNSTGAEILKMVQANKSEKDIAEELVKKYGSSREEIEGFVSKFLTELKDLGLLA